MFDEDCKITGFNTEEALNFLLEKIIQQVKKFLPVKIKKFLI